MIRFCIVFFLFAVVACSSSTKETKSDEMAEVVETPTAVEETAEEEDPEIGQVVYSQYCIVCHMADGNGVPGLNPPLTNSEWVNGEKETLIKIVLNGSQGGQYPVDGETFTNIMTAHNFLTDEQIAGVLTYVRSNFENDSDAVTAEEVAVVRASNQ